MKKQVPPSVFFVVLTIFVAFVGYLLYKQATDPIYHHEPTDEDAIRQFSKQPAPPKSEGAPKSKAAPKADGAAKSGPPKTEPANTETAPKSDAPPK